MLTLNLIPQKLKKEAKLGRLYKELKRIGYILIIAAIIIAITLLTAKLILQNNFNKIIEQTTLVAETSQTHNVKVRDINFQMSQISQVQNDFMELSLLVEDLAAKTPENIALSLVKINRVPPSINISGYADTREGLLSFKKNLEESPVYFDIQFPLQNILQKENVSFEMSATLNLSLLKDIK
ncbi:PilN domain-containing protein [Candidatus Parcubacteria bacterium]|nr:PilN domain-containing protein [Candidatus Parcubacteria bacterium]MCG2701125.1 PilN domain-containing protein [Candidatus Parcubacteria bacterium]